MPTIIPPRAACQRFESMGAPFFTLLNICHLPSLMFLNMAVKKFMLKLSKHSDSCSISFLVSISLRGWKGVDCVVACPEAKDPSVRATSPLGSVTDRYPLFICESSKGMTPNLTDEPDGNKPRPLTNSSYSYQTPSRGLHHHVGADNSLSKYPPSFSLVVYYQILHLSVTPFLLYV
jgi:hypothetical protein